MFRRLLNQFINPSDIRFVVMVGYVFLVFIGLYHHEMWRDEYVEFLQARDTDGLFGLGNTMSQGHAMLWQTCLWVIIQFTHNPISMQFLHGCIALISAYLLIYKSPFKIWQSAIILSGYFLMFEYSVISRCYAFGVLFLFLFAHTYVKGQLNWKSALAVFLFANTSVYGMMLAGILCLWIFVNEIWMNDGDLLIKFKKNWPLLIFIGSGILISYFQIRPQEDNTYPLKLVTLPFDFYRFKVSFSQLFQAFLPIPDMTKTHFWNTNFLMGGKLIEYWYWTFPVLILTTLPFIKQASILWLWLGGVLLVLFFQYMTGFRFARYYGHFYIWWLSCFWMLMRLQKPSEFFRKLQWVILILFFVPQTLAGYVVYKADWNLKFSRGKEAKGTASFF